MKEKSFFVTVAIAASAKKIAAVMPPAKRDQLTAVAQARRRPSGSASATRPAMNVKPNSATTPQALLRSARDDEQRADHHAEHQRAAP